MRRFPAVVAVAAAAAAALLGTPAAGAAPSSGCSAGVCVQALSAGFYAPHGVVARRTHARVTFTFSVTGRPSSLTLAVRQSRHFPVVGNGSVQINSRPAPTGAASVRRNDVDVRIPDPASTDNGVYEISFVAAPDSTARADQFSYGTVAVTAPSGTTGRVNATAQVPLNRPLIRVRGYRGTPRPRRGGDTEPLFDVENWDPVVAHDADAYLTLSSGFSIGRKWRMTWNGHRVSCRGRYHHVHCVLPTVAGRDNTLAVDVHAARRLHAGHVGAVQLVVVPRGYDTPRQYNRATVHLRVRHA